VIVGGTAHRFSQPLAELVLQEADDLSHPLKREPALGSSQMTATSDKSSIE